MCRVTTFFLFLNMCTGDTSAVVFYNNVGVLHAQMGKHHLASHYFRQAMRENELAYAQVRPAGSSAPASASSAGNGSFFGALFFVSLMNVRSDRCRTALIALVRFCGIQAPRRWPPATRAARAVAATARRRATGVKQRAARELWRPVAHSLSRTIRSDVSTNCSTTSVCYIQRTLYLVFSTSMQSITHVITNQNYTRKYFLKSVLWPQLLLLCNKLGFIA